MWNDAASLLRAEGRHAVGRVAVPWRRIAALVVIAGSAYGAVMGALGGRELGVAHSAIKLPILLVFSLATCLPSFYVMNAVLGLRDDFAAAVRGILSAQGTFALALVSLAPVTAFLYACGVSYPTALLWNGAAFALSLACAQKTLARHYRPLVARNRRHRVALALWFALYTFVSIKAGWVLRPFVGDPALPLEFLRAGKWAENPYMTLFWTGVGFVWSVARRLVAFD
jgi:hypothetical protein